MLDAIEIQPTTTESSNASTLENGDGEAAGIECNLSMDDTYITEEQDGSGGGTPNKEQGGDATSMEETMDDVEADNINGNVNAQDNDKSLYEL
jgi:hypothetical protein